MMKKIDNINYTLKIKNTKIINIILLFIISNFVYFILTLINSKNLRLIFSVISSLLFIIFFILLVKDKGGNQLGIVIHGWDLFADFYNPLRYVADRNVYFNTTINGPANRNYLPLAFLFFYPFSLFKDYINMSLTQIQSDPISNCSFVIYMSFGILLLFLYLKKLGKKNDAYSNIIMLLMFLSSPIIVAIERGNIILHTVAFTTIFLALYKSENKTEQIIALISLGIASALKIYPVLLGFLLLQERRYKDIAIGSIITLLLVFLPFLFFENGFNNIPKFLENLKAFSQIYGIRYGLKNLSIIFNCLNSYASALTLVGYVLMLLSIIYSFVVKEYWKKVCLLLMLSIQQPTTGYYAELFLFPAIILFLNKDNFERKDYIFLILFSIHLMPLQIDELGWQIGSVASLIIWLMILFEAVIKNTGSLLTYCKEINSFQQLKEFLIGNE